MNLGKHIHELLLENDIVVIPGFGAFVSEYKPAEISSDDNEIKPPSKTVWFNPQIRNNDGLLVGHVAEHKRISHFDALIKIEKEREEILYKLDSGEQVKLEEIGTLFSTKENSIEFRSSEDDNLLLDAYGLETTSMEESPTKDIEEEQEPAPIIITTEQAAEIPEPEVEDEPTEDNTETENVAEEELEAPPIPPSDTEATPVDETPQTEEKEEEKKKRGWLWLLLVLIPLIAVSVFVIMKGYKDGKADKEVNLEIKQANTPEPLVTVIDSVETDSTAITAIDTTDIENTEIQTEASETAKKAEIEPEGPQYYLVGGSFSVEENAETYLKELQAKGVEAFHVGKKGRFYIVGLGKYTSSNEAEKAKVIYMSENPKSEVWVWKK